MNKKYFKLIPAVALGLAVGSGIIFSYSANAQQNTLRTVLQCFHEGDIMVAVPSVDDFLMTQTGMFLEARWTNPTTQEQEVLVTTLPCMYRVTLPQKDARPAD